MAAAVHGCSSPRQQQQQQQQKQHQHLHQHQHQHHQQHSNSIVASNCVTNSIHNPHQLQLQQQHQSTSAAPMYPTMPKYGAQQQLSLPSQHHHVYGGSSSGASAGHQQYSTPLPPMNYLPVGSIQAQQQTQPSQASPQAYASGQRSASVEACRSYWSPHPHAATMMYRASRQHSKRKSAVELLAETKPFYIKSDAMMERLHPVNYRSPAYGTVSERRGRDDGRCSGTYGDASGHIGSEIERHYGTQTQPGRGVHLMHHHHHHHHGTANASANATANASASVTANASATVTANAAAAAAAAAAVRHAHLMRTSVPPTSHMLQNKLRVLLNAESTRERDRERERERERDRGDRADCYRPDITMPMHHYDYGNKLLGMNVGGTCNKEMQTVAFADEESMTARIPPPGYSHMSMHSFDSIYNNYGQENSSGDEPLVLTENYRPISPPAEYAATSHPSASSTHDQSRNQPRTRYNYQRSYSHSHEIAAENGKYTAVTYNINSHKSLPDLHSQISRHSPHSEILSCCSRGNRSIKSAGESSLNRDSGGSSGHYTHRSEPCYRQRETETDHLIDMTNCCNALPMTPIRPVTPIEYRRDSGSSTQHSANSYCGYASLPYPRSTDCAECRCKSATQFDSSDYLLNFTTPEVPEAFKDDYTPPSPSVAGKYKTEEMLPSRYSSSYTSQQLLTSQAYSSNSGIKHSHNSLVQSPGSAPSIEEVSPPPIQFKRQKCIRFKNRSRISLPTTAMATSANVGGGGGGTMANEPNDIYQKIEQQPQSNTQTYFFPKCFAANSEGYQSQDPSHTDASLSSNTSSQQHSDVGMGDTTHDTDSIPDLERFFDRLGLNDEKFFEIYKPIKRHRSANASDSDDSSTVFFSDVSTVDSMRLPDSTETQPQTTQAYRPTEPPSIVERNARIIKWLCNCRKLQYV